MLVPAGYHSMQEVEEACRAESEKIWPITDSYKMPEFKSDGSHLDNDVLFKQMVWVIWLIDLLLYENRHNIFAYSFGHDPIKVGGEIVDIAKYCDVFPDEGVKQMKKYFLANGLEYAFIDREYWEITPRLWHKHAENRETFKKYWREIQTTLFHWRRGGTYKFRGTDYYYKQIEKRLKPVKGWALCFSDAGFEDALATIPNLLDFRKNETPKSSNIGRPSIQNDLRIAYAREFPDGHTDTWKLAMQQIRQNHGIQASIKTLKRSLGKEE